MASSNPGDDVVRGGARLVLEGIAERKSLRQPARVVPQALEADAELRVRLHHVPDQHRGDMSKLDFATCGIPSEADYVAAYCRRTGRDHLPNKDYLVVFNMFRLAAILHGSRGRGPWDHGRGRWRGEPGARIHGWVQS